MTKNSFVDEAKKLLELIDSEIILKKEDYLFVESMKARVRVNGFISDKQIYWLRDIKDRQLERD